MRVIRLLTSGSVLMFVAVVLGLATAGATFVWLDGQAAEDDSTAAAAAESLPTREVVVLLEDVPAGASLPDVALAVRRVPADEALDGVHASLTDLVGRVVRYPMYAGEQVTESKLVTPDTPTGSGLAYTVAPGQRAVSVPVSEVTGAGGLIVPGDRVDVMVATKHERVFGPSGIEGDDDDLAEQTTVVTVLQDVLVLAVGQELAGAADPGQDQTTMRADDVAPQPTAHSVTLAVDPDQAQTLFMASQEGPLGFAVRSFGDGSRDALKPLSLVEPAPGVPNQVNRADAP